MSQEPDTIEFPYELPLVSSSSPRYNPEVAPEVFDLLRKSREITYDDAQRPLVEEWWKEVRQNIFIFQMEYTAKQPFRLEPDSASIICDFVEKLRSAASGIPVGETHDRKMNDLRDGLAYLYRLVS